MSVTLEMRQTYRTLRAFFEGDPNLERHEVEWGLGVLGAFLTMPHHGSEAVTGVALKCGYCIATNGDLIVPDKGAHVPADALADYFASYAAERGELSDLPTTTEPEEPR